ncbi:cell division protein ZapA [Thioalkalivibrio thiocyanodenitrificans]|jgi:cell division protein ZapA|uniref:cell division protein ZapA n=1 Tax=Thioalkalivibrio thiocyanodenitrificans TaxID=243063 RepID=UPI0003790057|nr:cell division protein ZapA [Thioalkalivibrio thiocyanodenitrificans]
MSNRPEPVSVQILGKEYQVACPDDERSALLASASLLDRRMQEIRDSGRIIGGDRIAVIAALNITHEMLVTRNQRESLSQTLSTRIRALQEKIDDALENGQQMDL